ncbi:cyclase family protein [Lentisphaera marina]|uniref:cyclase family protein n=1 Tax=Lentisphaera marina TaxID=1111041 RepID=UPI002366BCD0|nr:cyclase family protein [Lentisphaera marina]MDD7986555.1 cyclase family protein [Lentisphaera marina]
MKYLSHFLNKNTPLYGNRKENLSIENASCICSGAVANSLKISFNNHVGTHIDLPKHFDDNGPLLNDYPADFWKFSSIELLDLPCQEEYLISIADLEGKISEKTDFLIIRTGFEKFRYEEAYWKHNPGVDNKVGLWLRENFPQLRAIGFDFISLNCFQKPDIGTISHREFLSIDYTGHPILIVEDMKLAEITGPIDSLVVAPLLLDKADGVPVTIFAF